MLFAPASRPPFAPQMCFRSGPWLSTLKVLYVIYIVCHNRSWLNSNLRADPLRSPDVVSEWCVVEHAVQVDQQEASLYK